jgi:hypothetical protein
MNVIIGKVIYAYNIQNISDMVWFMVLNATFNNISAISWRPVLVGEEAGVPGENHRQALIYFKIGSMM